MHKILLIGAGKSSVSLIKYLSENAGKENWQLTVADTSLVAVREKIKDFDNTLAIELDINIEEQLQEQISKVDIVISLLPAHMHLNVAKKCLHNKTHLVTASYISKEMSELDIDAKNQGLVFMNECGLDPGIDHMSAMKIINDVKSKHGEVLSFKSYCGGLVAPESNDNPWGYKFSWNPRNVILAGQGTAQYIEENQLKYIPYNRLFLQIDTVEVDGYGKFDAYANRDSLSYRKPYGLENISTMLRGTLRQVGYCNAWNVFVKLGLTDDSYRIIGSENMSYAQLIDAYLPAGKDTVKNKLVKFMGKDMTHESIEKIEWLGIFSDKKITFKDASPAQILQSLLEEKWKLKAEDKDMIVMQHIFKIKTQHSEIKNIKSSLIVKGDDSTYTAMAKTVGLPAAIATKLILHGKLPQRGVVMPTDVEVYEPTLKELEFYGIRFIEKIA